MSNGELRPDEIVCVAGGDCPEGMELIEARDVPLGGVRAMRVRRTIPQRKRSLIGAWCFLDHYGPEDVAMSGGMNVAAHPHTGLQTVSWLFSGEIEHRDSAGFHAFVKPGELNLMTSGQGISHSERSTPETTLLHGAQLWVALPESSRHGEKTFEHYVPEVIHGDGWQAQVFMGSLAGATSPVHTHTPLVGAELRFEAGTAFTFAIDERFEHGVLVDAGDVRINGASVPVTTLAYLAPGHEHVTITVAEDSPARLLLIGGEPFPEEIVMWWNFIGRNHEEIAQARADWQAQISQTGVGDPSDPHGESGAHVQPRENRFGLPEHEPEPPLPAPKLPVARLKPRGRR